MASLDLSHSQPVPHLSSFPVDCVDKPIETLKRAFVRDIEIDGRVGVQPVIAMVRALAGLAAGWCGVIDEGKAA